MRETYQPPAISPAVPLHDHTPKETAHPAVDGNRHNATEFNEPLRKLVPARDARESCRTHHPRHSREGRNPSSLHGLRPGRSRFDVPLETALP